MSSSTPSHRPAPGRSSSSREEAPPAALGGNPPSAAQPASVETLVRAWLSLNRFGWDALGLFLLALAVLSTLGLLNLTHGLFITPWVRLIRLSFGWGSPLVIVAFVVLALSCFRHYFHVWPKVSLSRVLALEGLAFCVLTFLSILGGMDLARAEKGQDGGVIGWGLAVLLDQLLPGPLGTILVLVLGLFLGGVGFGTLQWGLRALERWLNELSKEKPTQAGPESPAPVKPQVEETREEALAGPLERDPRLPPLTLLMEELPAVPDESVILETGQKIEQTLAEFGLPVRVMGYRMGPTITQFAVEPGYIERTGPDGEVVQQKVRVAQISALQRDLALALSAERLRIEAPVPGHSYVGIEVPNPKNTTVRLRSLMESPEFQKLQSPLAIALGKDVSGQPLVADLARMPHLLIAGTTGSGKSVCIAAIVTCLVMNNHPERLKLALMDPKMVELSRFNGLPHLFGRVETDVERMLGVLKWALMEMDNRYRLLETARARDIDVYNRRASRRGEATLPRIVVLIDELADLMMSAPEQTEHSLVRLAQMARAVGIHLVVATQRPSTDVVTGLIKANFPARLAFTVASSVDSRVILDTTGAETLLGKGDMLFLNPEAGVPIRAQGVMVSDQEVAAIQQYWKHQEVPGSSAEAPWEEWIAQVVESGDDALIQDAIAVVRRAQRASVSLLQRRLRIGYPRAARLIDQLEEMGVVGPSQGSGKDREVLLSPEEEDEEDEPE